MYLDIRSAAGAEKKSVVVGGGRFGGALRWLVSIRKEEKSEGRRVFTVLVLHCGSGCGYVVSVRRAIEERGWCACWGLGNGAKATRGKLIWFRFMQIYVIVQ